MKVIFLHFFSVHLCFLYSKVNDICVLSLHPGTLMKVFINCASFLEVSLKHFMYKIKSYTKKDTYSLTSVFLFAFHWSLSVGCAIYLATVQVLCCIGMKRIGNFFSFLILVQMLWIYFHLMLTVGIFMIRYVLYMPSLSWAIYYR